MLYKDLTINTYSDIIKAYKLYTTLRGEFILYCISELFLKNCIKPAILKQNVIFLHKKLAYLKIV
jgi:hypothetical protein